MVIQTNYKEDISKYTSKVNDAALAAIIKFCGIALRGEDSQYVAVTDDVEVKRVVDGFAAKKLGLTAEAAKAGIKKVHETMKADRTKMRTTVYYLLAENTGTLGKLT